MKRTGVVLSVIFWVIVRTVAADDISVVSSWPPGFNKTAPAWTPAGTFADAAKPAIFTLPNPWSGPYTLAAWVRLARLVPGEAFSESVPPTIAVVYESGKAQSQPYIQWGIVDGKVRVAQRFGDNKWRGVVGTTRLQPGQWVHVAAQCDGFGTLRVFVNGKQDGLKSGKDVPKKPVDRIQIGAAGKRILQGDVALLTFFGGALDAKGMEALAGASTPALAAKVLASGFEVRKKEINDREKYPNYNGQRLQVAAGVKHPFAGGLSAKALVVPVEGKKRPDLLVQSRGGGEGSYYLPNTEEPVSPSPDIFQMGRVSEQPFLKWNDEPVRGGVFLLRLPGHPDALAFAGKNPVDSKGEIFRAKPPRPGQKALEIIDTIPCGPNAGPLSQAYPGQRVVFIGQVDDDGIPDLILATSRNQGDYYPDAPKNFWTGNELPNSGPGKGYTVNGRWLGGESITTFFWAKGEMADGKLRFGAAKLVYQGDGDFALQWKGVWGATAAGIRIGGKAYFIAGGDLDYLLIMPVAVRNGAIHCGPALNLLANDARLNQVYIPGNLVIADMDGDGADDVVVSGNPGSVCILSGKEPGKFVEKHVYTIGGPVAMQTLVVETKADWDGDGIEDLIAGDASGWLMFWPGTKDPGQYGVSVYFTVHGKPVHIQAGYAGSIQGPNEARWGYLNPTACDWDGDGKPEIISCDINGDLLLWKRADKPFDLQPPVRFTMNGKPLPVAWRHRPAFVSSKFRMTGDNRPCLLIQDYDGDLAVAVPKSTGSAEIERVTKLKYKDGGNVLTCGPCGLWGRSKFLYIDWDGDGVQDVLFSTNRASNRFFYPDLPVFGAMPFFLKNVGSNSAPVFERPVPVKYKGEFINVGTHIAALWPEWSGGKVERLLIGGESGSIYTFNRTDLVP